MILRLGEPRQCHRRYALRPGAYAVLPRNGKLLLTVQFGHEVEIQLPGGGIDAGESSIAALHREVFEETGWRISKPKRLGAFRRFVFLPEYDIWAEKICHVFLARPTRSVSPPIDRDHEVLWAVPQRAICLLNHEGDRFFASQV
ncbi:MAG: NUDIX hydrolase [Aestuariivita sp.]|nr:NUDIX hydrolase [Aestuariivita sp.]MCY4202914.1 NUDIX hydrolase [Aestuariivita sp.]